MKRGVMTLAVVMGETYPPQKLDQAAIGSTEYS